ncbi:DUF927 domain-containing protein [Alkanindiges illinoisensis]|nr:DUF927 domain-containing protein [Alkanindiges illinoisensis]
MKDTDNTIDLWDEPFCGTGALPVNQTEFSEQYEAGQQNVRARANHADSTLLQDQAKAYALKYASSVIKLGYVFKYLFCYTDVNGKPVYFKARYEHANFDNLPADEQEQIASKARANRHKWIRALSFNCHTRQWRLKEPDYTAAYPAGNGKKPLYRLVDMVQADTAQSVYIFEGEQKADYAASLGLVATTCGSSGSITTTHLEPLAGRSVVIWPDNDEAGIKARDEIAAALQAVGCSVLSIDIDALGLPEKGDIVDWVQQRTNNSQTTTKADIEALSLIKCQVISGSADSRKILSNTSGNIPKGHLCEPLYSGGNDARFEILPHGIFYIAKDQHDNERAHFICSPVLVIAKTRDTHGNAWGRLLQWHDDERRLHQWAMPMQLLQGDGSEVRRELADQGVTISPERKSRDLLTTYLNGYPSDTFALCVDRLGWHGLRYVMPQHTYGEQQGQLTVFQQNSVMAASFYPLGSLADWQQQISQPCGNHSRLVFALACAFAGQLLEPLNEQGGGFHIRGDSSSGKSTALKLAGSVWGDPEQVIRQWRATSNALEGIAALHNDNFLGLDEIGQCNAKDIGDTVYMLSNGQGKARMQRTGITRPVSQWRVMFLSNGEESLAAIMQQTGKRTNAGQEIRLADIPADAGHGLGIFDPLSTDQPPAAYAEQLKQASASNHGTAGIAWLEYLTSNKAAVTEQAQVYIQQFMQDYASSKNGQVQRVARRFAIVAAAGELATLAGITAWQQGRAIEAIGQCFNAWLNGFGDGANLESRNILAEVKAFFEAHGSSRFENMQPPVMNDGSDMLQRIINRVGYYRQDDNSRAYLVYPEQFKSEICKGRDDKQVIKILKAAGWLILGDGGRNQKKETLPDGSRPRMYVFNNRMWEWDNEASAELSKSSGTGGTSGTDQQPQGLQPVPVQKAVVGQSGTGEISLVMSQSVPAVKTAVGQHKSLDNKGLSQVSQLSHCNNDELNSQIKNSRRAVL